MLAWLHGCPGKKGSPYICIYVNNGMVLEIVFDWGPEPVKWARSLISSDLRYFKPPSRYCVSQCSPVRQCRDLRGINETAARTASLSTSIVACWAVDDSATGPLLN